MTGSVALDVVIGLVFIYLLYSLFATVVAEIIATNLGLRARNLETAIKRMLTDDNKRGWGAMKIPAFIVEVFHALISYFYVPSPEKPNLFTKFYNNAEIKYLSTGNFFRKPSYINPESFSKAIFDILKSEGGKEGSDLEKIRKSLENNSVTCDSKIKEITQLVETSNPDIGKIKSILSLRADFVDIESVDYIKSLLDDAQNDLQKFKILLENWYDRMMDRATGWYKRKIQFLLLLVGLLIAVGFNANTFRIVNTLSSDKNARDQMIQIGNTYLTNYKGLVDEKGNIVKSDQWIIDSLKNVQKELRRDVDKVNSLLGLGWYWKDSILIYCTTVKETKSPKKSCCEWYTGVKSVNKTEESTTTQRRDSVILNKEDTIIVKCSCCKDSVKFVFVPKGLEKNIVRGLLDNTATSCKTDCVKKGFDKWGYFWITLRRDWIGYLITAIAISLGAPFWFDLLSKIMQLRGSLQQITSSSSDSKDDKKQKVNTVG